MAISGEIEINSSASFECEAINVKSENSKPGATEHPTKTFSEMGSAACHMPAGITWQKQLLLADNSVHIGGVSDPSHVYRFNP